MTTGRMFDVFTWLALGVAFIAVSIRQREKLGKKAAGVARIGGILFVIFGVLKIVWSGL